MKSFIQDKLNLRNDLLARAVEKAAYPQGAHDGFMAPAGMDTNAEQTDNDAFLQDERMRTEAEIVKKLPKTFPIQEWEKMTTKQQKKAMEFSGLNEKEQWKILNAGAPLNILAQYPTRMYAMTDGGTSPAAPLGINKTVKENQPPKPTKAELVAALIKNTDFLYDWVKGIGVDTGNMTRLQKKIIADALQIIKEKTFDGTITDAKRRKIAIETGNEIAAKTSTPEKTYKTYLDTSFDSDSQKMQNYKVLYDWMERIGLNTRHLTAAQAKILNDAEKEMMSWADIGLLTDARRKKIVIKAGNEIAAKTSTPEKTYKTYLDTGFIPKPIPPYSAPSSEVKQKSRMEQVAEAVAKSKYGDYVEDTYKQYHDEFVKALRRGDVTRDDYQDYFDVVEEVVFENTEKPIPIGEVPGEGPAEETIPIGELISPYDNSFGAQVTREALKLIGVKYNEPAMQGLKSKMDIDCSRLVNWAVTEVNPFWGEYGIGKGARHQIYQSEVIWDSEMGKELKSGDLQVGDTLFWRGDETDKVTHTAIYIGSIDDRLLMIESGNGGVHIEEIRMETHNSNGEGSTLVQVNRMTPERMQENAEKNNGSH